MSNTENTTRRDFLRVLSGGALTLASGGLLTGCGGAGGGSGSRPSATAGGSTFTAPAQTGSARATVHILWPNAGATGSARPRLIPEASNFIKIDISNGTTPVTTQVIAKPTPSYTFDALPAGSLTVTCAAYPDASASGVAQAAGTGTLVTQAGQTAALTVTMDSTVDHLTIMPASATVAVGQTQPLAATAFDASGAIVMIAPANLQWNSDSSSAATVDANGVVTGVAQGSTNITVRESESQKLSPPVPVTVTAASVIASIEITPNNPQIAVGYHQQMHAIAKDANGNILNNVSFLWTSSDNSYATVDGNGLITAVSTSHTVQPGTTTNPFPFISVSDLDRTHVNSTYVSVVSFPTNWNCYGDNTGAISAGWFFHGDTVGVVHAEGGGTGPLSISGDSVHVQAYSGTYLFADYQGTISENGLSITGTGTFEGTTDTFRATPSR